MPVAYGLLNPPIGSSNKNINWTSGSIITLSNAIIYDMHLYLSSNYTINDETFPNIYQNNEGQLAGATNGWIEVSYKYNNITYSPSPIIGSVNSSKLSVSSSSNRLTKTNSDLVDCCWKGSSSGSGSGSVTITIKTGSNAYITGPIAYIINYENFSNNIVIFNYLQSNFYFYNKYPIFQLYSRSGFSKKQLKFVFFDVTEKTTHSFTTEELSLSQKETKNIRSTQTINLGHVYYVFLSVLNGSTNEESEAIGKTLYTYLPPRVEQGEVITASKVNSLKTAIRYTIGNRINGNAPISESQLATISQNGKIYASDFNNIYPADEGFWVPSGSQLTIWIAQVGDKIETKYFNNISDSIRDGW